MQNNFPKVPLLLSIIFFMFSCFAFFFLYREINNNNKKLQLAENEWQVEAFRQDEIKMLENSIKIVEGEKAQLETHFAQSSDIVPFLDTIEELAGVAGTKAEVVSVDILEDYAGLSVGMKASGAFNGLYKFFTLLENSPYELEFISIDMHRETGPDASGKNVTVPKWNCFLKIKLLSFIQ